MKKPFRFTIGCVIGTRPELIKMAPVFFQLQKCSWANAILINTAQHREMLDTMLNVFNLKTHYDLNVMKTNQSLGDLTGNLCNTLDALVKAHHFDILLAAGDTTTVFVSSLIAFYNQRGYLLAILKQA